MISKEKALRILHEAEKAIPENEENETPKRVYINRAKLQKIMGQVVIDGTPMGWDMRDIVFTMYHNRNAAGKPSGLSTAVPEQSFDTISVGLIEGREGSAVEEIAEMTFEQVKELTTEAYEGLLSRARETDLAKQDRHI